MKNLREKLRGLLSKIKNSQPLSKKPIALIATLCLAIALPLFTWAAINMNFNPFKRAASGEPLPPEDGPVSTPICKVGLNSFSVDTTCENGNYRYMTYSCYDGSGNREGGPTSCKSYETWLKYANDYCSGKSSCATPPPDTQGTPVPSTATPAPVCKRNLHTVTMTPATQAGFPGDTLYYQATVVNNDTQGCEGSWFNWKSILPRDTWSASFSPASAFLGPGQSRVVTAGFTSGPKNPVETVPVAISVSGSSGTVSATSAYQVVLSTASSIPSPIPTKFPPYTPTASPKPTSSPIPNRAPVITTYYISPLAFVDRSYSANLNAYDVNANDNLSASVLGLPSGVGYRCYTNLVSGSRKNLTCQIYGTPKSTGYFKITFIVTDQYGARASRNYSLIVMRRPIASPYR